MSLIEFVDMIKGLPNRVVLSNAQVNYNGKNAVSQNSHRFIDIHLIIGHLNVFNVIMWHLNCTYMYISREEQRLYVSLKASPGM